MSNEPCYFRNPREYALWLVEEGYATEHELLVCLLKYMSHENVRDALDHNEYSPEDLRGEP
jgi:hypothetical protein